MLLSKKEPIIPPPDEINPQLPALIAKRDALAAELPKLLIELRELALVEEPASDAERDLRVATILGRVAPNTRPRVHDRKAEIETRRRDVTDAVEVLDREIATERNRASAVIQSRMAPEYRKRIAAFATALISAHNAYGEIGRLVTAISDGGYSAGSMTAHGSRFMADGSIGHLLREIAADGLINARDLPEGLH